jgi:repressor LexA
MQEPLNAPFTPLQGQYLAFIRAYSLINRRPPAEADMQAFFRVAAPSVHRMVMTLAAQGLVERVPGKARSLRLLVSPGVLPHLCEPEGEQSNVDEGLQ